jgi:hypothetical protein
VKKEESISMREKIMVMIGLVFMMMRGMSLKKRAYLIIILAAIYCIRKGM